MVAQKSQMNIEPFIPERIAEWAYWIRERENIRIKKEERLEAPPWSNDETMRRTRWCNVRRMDDKVSKWLLKYWYRNVVRTGDFKEALIAGLLARMINRPATLAILASNGYRSYDAERFREAMYSIKNGGGQVFTNAYIINGASGGPKIDQVLNAISLAYERQKHDKTRYFWPNSMQKTAESLFELPGVGSFISGQVVADLRHVLPKPHYWLDRMQWAPVGPGSSRGMRYLVGDISASEIGGRGNDMNQKKFLPLLQKLIAIGQEHEVVGPISKERKLEAHDYQNTLCETGKYIRVKYGVGRAKNQYDDSKSI